MKKIRIVSMVMILSFLLSPILGSWPTQKVSAATTLNVDTSNVIQSNFLGVGAVYHGFSYMPESNAKGYNDALRNIEFNRVDAMDLPIARTWYRPDWAYGQSGYTTANWNSEKMTAFYNWLQAMKDKNVDVAINAGWWFPYDVYNVSPFATPDPNTWDTSLTQWATWMSESLNQMINVRGFTNVKYVMLFTEPQNAYVGTLPAGLDHFVAYKNALNALNNKLIADGIRSLVKLVGPNSGNYSTGTSVSDSNNVIDIYSAHGYNRADYTAWYNDTIALKNMVSSTGKPFWVDEYGNGNDRNTPNYGNYIAQANAAMINAGAQNTQIWLLFDQQYAWPLDTTTNADSFDNGVHKWGTARFLPNTQTPRPSYYIFSLMSKYLGRAGTQVYQTTNGTGIYITAVKLPSGDWSYMVVNGTSSAQDISVNLSSPLNKTLYRYLYDPATLIPDSTASMIGYDKAFSNVSTSFMDTLPANGVAIYSSIKGTPKSTAVNLALNKPIIASSTNENADWGIAKSVDGQMNSVTGSFGWSSNSSLWMNHTEWIQVDLGSVNLINKVNLFPRNDYLQLAVSFPIDFTIQTSTDGTNWTPVVTQTGYPIPRDLDWFPATDSLVQGFNFGSINARYVKVEGTNLRFNNNEYTMQFAEIGVYGDGDSLALNMPITASSTLEYAGWGKVNVVDAQKNSVTGSYGWTSDNSLTTNHAEWVQTDLGSVKQIQRVDLYPRNDAGTVGYGFPIDFTIQTSMDGITWATAVTQTGYALPGNSAQIFPFIATDARYVRVEGTNLRINPGDGNRYRMQFAEMEVYNNGGPPNFAIGSIPTVSSDINCCGWTVANAIDGNKNSGGSSYGWSSNNSTSMNHTEWFQVNLGSSQTVSKVKLFPRNDAGTVGYGFPIDFTIQTSMDGITWATAVTQTGYALPGNSAQIFPFIATDARYVRVEGTNLRINPGDGNRYRMQFAEVEIY